MTRKITYIRTSYKRFPTSKLAEKAAKRVNGAFTEARGYKKDDKKEYKTGFVAYSTRKKVKGWKSDRIGY